MEHLDLDNLLTTRFEQSTAVPTAFFMAQDALIAEACWALARRFHQGGRLLAFGNGAWATDAQHVSVEFVHPVIVGKRALPALALTNDSAILSGLAADKDEGAFARQIRVLSRPQDIAMGFSPDGNCHNVLTALTVAQQRGLLTLGLCGGSGGLMAHNPEQPALNFCFTVPTDDPLTIQETHETLYHILWELTHIFFEHEGLLI